MLWDISAHEDRLRSQKESGHSDKSKTAVRSVCVWLVKVCVYVSVLWLR